jgi:hypothetical protein
LKRRLCLCQLTRFDQRNSELWEKVNPSQVVQRQEPSRSRQEVDGSRQISAS